MNYQSFQSFLESYNFAGFAIAGTIFVGIAYVLGQLTRYKPNGPGAPPKQRSATARTPTARVEPPVPRRKLFLSYSAVVRAVESGAVEMEELAQCLFCTSDAEMELARERDCRWMEYLYPHLTQALKEGRMLNAYGQRHYNPTTLAQVNELLARNGVAPLFVADTTSKLEDIPMYSCVPRITDHSMEVLWATHPLRGDWKRCWGSLAVGENLTDDPGQSDPSGDSADASDGSDPIYGTPKWMQDLNRPIIEEAHRKHGQTSGAAAANSGGDSTDDTERPADEAWRESLEPVEGEGPASDAWRESLEPDDVVGPETDEPEDDDEDNEPWRRSLRPDND